MGIPCIGYRKLSHFMKQNALLGVVGDEYSVFSIYIDYTVDLTCPSEVDYKILLLKVPPSLTVEYRGAMQELRWKFPPSWLAFIIPESARQAAGRQQSATVSMVWALHVNLAGKRCLLGKQWQNCYGTNWVICYCIRGPICRRGFVPCTMNLVKVP